MALPVCSICGRRYRELCKHMDGPCMVNILAKTMEDTRQKLVALGWESVGSAHGLIRKLPRGTYWARYPAAVFDSEDGPRVSYTTWAPRWAVRLAALTEVPYSVRRQAILFATPENQKAADAALRLGSPPEEVFKMLGVL